LEHPYRGTELFDRSSDPREHRSVAGQHPDVIERERAIVEHLTRLGLRGSRAEEAQIDDSVRRELRALGYVD
jgi:hypothetical protein